MNNAGFKPPKIPKFEQAHVLVIGDVMLDRYWTGGADRVSPEAPVPVVHIKHHEERPGGAGNVAYNIVALGAKVTLIGLVGDDDAGHALETQLRRAKVDTHLLRMKDVPTVTKLRVLSRHQQLIRLDFEEPFQDDKADEIVSLMEAHIASAGAVIFSDYGKGTLKNLKALMAIANAHNVPVLVDPKTDDFGFYSGATVITPNFKEYQAAVGACHTEEEIVSKGRKLMKQHHIESLLVTRGERGMTLLHQDSSEMHLPAREREVFDVSGAGDTVIAMMAAAMATGCDLQTAMVLSNVAAGIVVGKLGAATVSVPELEMAMANHKRLDVGVVNQTQLQLAVQEARMRGEKIVMTNGCFDILHVGHVTYLKQAKALGARLIVAVNDDASVKRLKGEGRPINNLDQRMLVLASLDMVDWVVPFSQDTPADLIGAVLPDVLVKGGDYKVHEIAGHEAVLANGGQVKILTFVDDISTTSMLDKLQNKTNE